jgi:hypothetical protein
MSKHVLINDDLIIEYEIYLTTEERSAEMEVTCHI